MLYLFTQLFVSVRQHKPTGELSGMWLDLSMNTEFIKNYMGFYINMHADVYGEKDFYEPRTPGMYFRRPKYVVFNTGINTDSRKTFSISVGPFAAMTGEYGGSFSIGTNIEPYVRVNDHLTLGYSFRIENNIDDIGFVDRQDGTPIFGKRDINTVVNVFSGNYIFRNNLSLGLRARHYWSQVEYEKYYALEMDGRLRDTDYTDPEGFNNINYNAFNIDVLFNWEFAPGSALSLSYKNSIFGFDNMVEGNLFNNLRDLFSETQTNSVSLKLIYYLDYTTVRSWADNRRVKREA